MELRKRQSSLMEYSKGSVLVLGLLVMAVLLMIGGIFLSLTVTNVAQIQTQADYVKAEYLAMAGLNKVFHDLREGYLDHQYELRDIEFDEGKSTVGTVPLSRLGIHEILVVSIGIIKNPAGQNLVNKQSVVAGIVKLNTPTDYVLFVDGDQSFRVGIEDMPLSLVGPLHINGNLYLKLRQLSASPPVFMAMLKPKEVKGPVIDVSRRVIYEGMTGNLIASDFQYQDVKIIAGIGSFIPSGFKGEWYVL